MIFRIACIVFASLSVVYAAESFWPGKVLSTKEAAAKWGAQAFDVDKFRGGEAQIRASMASDLLLKQDKFIGKSVEQIRGMFGEHDGHYFNDWIPAYLIQEGKKKGDETWQVVFLPNKDRKISKIIVHKNCCD